MAREIKSSVRLLVVSDDLGQTAVNCPDYAYAEKYARSTVQFGSDDINMVNKTFPIMNAYAFLEKFGGDKESSTCDMVGIVDFGNTKSPEFAQFMYAYILANGIYCYAINIDSKKVANMKQYVQMMCKENELYSEAWDRAVSTIDFDDPSVYLLCGVVAANFESRAYQTVVHVSDNSKPVDLLICSVLSCYDPLSGNPVITKDSVRDIEDYGDEDVLNIEDANVKTIILNLR